jgi:hypothetical protein
MLSPHSAWDSIEQVTIDKLCFFFRNDWCLFKETLKSTQFSQQFGIDVKGRLRPVINVSEKSAKFHGEIMWSEIYQSNIRIASVLKPHPTSSISSPQTSSWCTTTIQPDAWRPCPMRSINKGAVLMIRAGCHWGNTFAKTLKSSLTR